MQENTKSRVQLAEEKRKMVAEAVAHATDDKNNTVAETHKVANEISYDVKRTLDIVDHAPAIIHDIHTQFEMATQLKGKDIAFLFGAAVIQTIRWVLLPRLDLDFSRITPDKRQSAQEGGRLEKSGIIENLEKEGYDSTAIRNLLKHDHINNYTWEKLLIAPVPYDAMHGSKRINIPGIKSAGVELYGKNHHIATWGHDPIWGWLFGPLNITARMITFRDFQTYHVAQQGDTFNQVITYQSSVAKMMTKSIDSWKEDSKRLFFSVVKQKLHLQSDKYTKLGLPIPFISAETAQRLLLKGWNSYEVERMFTKAAKNLGIIGAQFGLALIIDNLVKALHLLCYDEAIDGSINAYSVRTQKVVCYSNALAEITNGIYVATTRDLEKLDIGGYANFVKNLLSASKLRTQVEAEFLEKEMTKVLYGEKYYWEGTK